MITVRDPKCICGGGLMPLWRSSKWVCSKCKLEQSLSESKIVVDNWDK
jgi:hypothetical protein